MTKEVERTRVRPKLLDDVKAKVVFATNAPAFSIDNGVVTITLSAAQWDNSEVPAKLFDVVIARLAMPVASAQNLAVGLHDFLTKQGHSFVSKDEKDRMQ